MKMPLEDELGEIDIQQKTEMGDVAEQLFEDKVDKVTGLSAIDQKTNLCDEEVGLCMINDNIFREIGMPELSPTRQFKRLASSRNGWKTEAFVRTAQATNDNKQGAGFGQKLAGLFQPRQ